MFNKKKQKLYENVLKKEKNPVKKDTRYMKH